MKKIYITTLAVLFLAGNTFAQGIKENAQPLNYDSKVGPGKTVFQNNSTQGSLNKVSYLDEDWDTGVFPNGWTVSSGPASTITVGTQTWHENTSGNPGNCATILYDNSVDVHDEWLTKSGISLPATGVVRLQFEYNTSNYWFISPYDNGDVTVNISTDGGTTWDTIWWEQNATYDTYVWTTEFIDMSAYLGQTIDIGIHYDGQDAAQFNIDNISLYDVEGVDLGITGNKFYYTTGNAKIKYSQIPLTQMEDMSFSANVNNIGAETADSVVLTVDVAGANTHSAASNITNVVPSSPAVTIDDNAGNFNPSSTGLNSIIYAVSCDTTDNDLADNSWSDSLTTTDHVYARDNGTLDGWFAPFDDDGDMVDDPMEFIGQFEINTAENIYGITAVFTDATPVGQEIYYNVYYDDGAGGFTPVYDGVTLPIPTYTLTASDLTSTSGATVWVKLPFSMPVDADPAISSNWYPVVGYDFDGFDMAVSGDANDTTNFLTVFGTAGGGQSNYFITSVPMIRISFDPDFAIRIDEETADLALGQNIPNPFNGTTIIPFTLVNAGNVTFTVTDVTGKIIETRNMGVLGSGDQNIEFDGSNLAGGIYYYTLTVEGKRSTKKFSVAK